jgi:hypothetical protein
MRWDAGSEAALARRYYGLITKRAPIWCHLIPDCTFLVLSGAAFGIVWLPRRPEK